jgi:hypothetical protein
MFLSIAQSHLEVLVHSNQVAVQRYPPDQEKALFQRVEANAPLRTPHTLMFAYGAVRRYFLDRRALADDLAFMVLMDDFGLDAAVPDLKT